MRYILTLAILLVAFVPTYAAEPTLVLQPSGVVAYQLTAADVSALTAAMNAENARLTAESVAAGKIANPYTLETWIAEIVNNTIKNSVKAQRAKEYDAALGKLRETPDMLTAEDKAILRLK